MSFRSRRQILKAVAATGVAVSGGCSDLFGSSTAIPADAFPPGTDDTGFTDRNRLFEAHNERLRHQSFTYRESYNPIAREPHFEMTGRQTAGGDSAGRFVDLRATLSVTGPDVPYSVEGTRDIVSWRAQTTADTWAYNRISTDVSVTNPDRYNRSSEYAERYPPGERTTYRKRRENLLFEHRRAFVENLTLRNLALSPAGRYESGETSGVRFTIDGVRSENERSDSYVASGEVRIDSTGLIRRLDAAIGEKDENQRTKVSATFSALGTTTVPERPDWVDREFEGSR